MMRAGNGISIIKLMRTKATILDRSEKVLLKIPGEGHLMVEHEHLFLEVWIDIRDRLTFIMTTLQAINKKLPELPQNPRKPA